LARAASSMLQLLPVALAIRKGATKPDISSADALKQTLLTQNQLSTRIRRKAGPAASISHASLIGLESLTN
jgi:hypothetical protein